MIPGAFDYVRVASVDEALAALDAHGDDAKVLAGGHSLLPLMKLRLAMPSVLVDVAGARDALSYVREEDGRIAIGALTRHRDLETSALLAREAPLLAHAAGQVGDRQVRHRGTIGGSIAHGDPAADLPAMLLALDAELTLRSSGGERTVPASAFFHGFMETELRPDELLTEIRVPRCGDGGWSFQKLTRRAQDWAIVGVAVVRAPDTRVALVNMAPTPLRAAAVERALAQGAPAADAAELAAEGTAPVSDINGPAEYRRAMAQVLVRRALEEAGA